MTEISQELAGRMAALIRDLHADHVEYNLHDRVQDFVARTAAIVAELPVPIDPDLAEVREDLALFYENENTSKQWPNYFQPDMIADLRAGKLDATPPVRFGLIALKRGRELALSLDAESGK